MPGRAQDVLAFEEAVLKLLPDHGGRLLTRHVVLTRTDGDPLEIQVIALPDEAALSDYLEDPSRADPARTHDRDAIIV